MTRGDLLNQLHQAKANIDSLLTVLHSEAGQTVKWTDATETRVRALRNDAHALRYDIGEHWMFPHMISAE